MPPGPGCNLNAFTSTDREINGILLIRSACGLYTKLCIVFSLFIFTGVECFHSSVGKLKMRGMTLGQGHVFKLRADAIFKHQCPFDRDCGSVVDICFAGRRSHIQSVVSPVKRSDNG